MRVKSISKVSSRTVYAIKTSTGTYIADGLAHHNCVRCNKHLSGNLLHYEINLDKKYGEDTGQRLREVAKKGLDFQWNVEDLLDIQESCKTAIDYMLENYIDK